MRSRPVREPAGQPGVRAGRRPCARCRRLAVSAAFGAWLRRQREARGWSRTELAHRMADAAGSAVTAPAHVLESYLSRWEAGNVAISGRYRQLLDAVLGPGVGAPAAHPPSMPAPDPRQWVRAMRAIESGIADGQWKPGDQLPVRSALAQRYGLSAETVMRAQDELLRAGVLRRGHVYGALYVSDAMDPQPPGAPLPAASGPADRGRCGAVSPPARAEGGGTGTAPPPARNPRACARPDTRVPAVRADAGTEPGKAPARSPAAAGEPPPGDGLPQFMLVRECAAQIRVSPPTIYGLIKHGHVEAIRLGREFRIYTYSWLAYLHAPRPDLRPPYEPEGDGRRDHPPETDPPPAEPEPEPARGAGPGAPPVVFRAPG
jgi:excisionase family DNA binding protein